MMFVKYLLFSPLWRLIKRQYDVGNVGQVRPVVVVVVVEATQHPPLPGLPRLLPSNRFVVVRR